MSDRNLTEEAIDALVAKRVRRVLRLHTESLLKLLNEDSLRARMSRDCCGAHDAARAIVSGELRRVLDVMEAEE